MADAKDFLFEIGTEEMPSAPLNNAVKQLGTMIAKGLDEAGLAHGEVRVISSPRRLAALVTDVGNRDLIAVQSELFLLAAFFLTVGLVVDLLHRVLDPRLKTATAITEVTA